MPVKVLIDANVWLSYLLAPHVERTVTIVVRACLSDSIDLIFPPELLNEIETVLTTKPYFLERVSKERREDLIGEIQLFSSLAAPLETMPPFSRDRQDDYLIAYGLLNEINYLITGDKDLLVLRQIADLATVEPDQFFAVLATLS